MSSRVVVALAPAFTVQSATPEVWTSDHRGELHEDLIVSANSNSTIPGDVYLAEDTKLDRKVALKVLPPDTVSEKRLERFKREAKAIAAPDHPNIVQVFSVEEAEGTHFVTMQLVQGKTLTELLRPGRPIGELLRPGDPTAGRFNAGFGHCAAGLFKRGS